MWQTLTVAAIVAVAAVWTVRRLCRTLRGKDSGGCAGCPSAGCCSESGASPGPPAGPARKPGSA